MTTQDGEQPAQPDDAASAAPPPPPPAAPTEPAPAEAAEPASAAAAPAAPAPAAPSAPSATPASGSSYDAAAAVRGANPMDLGMIAAGVVAFFASMLPFYTASISGGGYSISAHVSAWHGFFGWFAALVALATAVVVALPLLNVSIPFSTAQIAVGGFGLSLLCAILALFIFPDGGSCNGVNSIGLGHISCNTGRGFGYWLLLLAVIVGTVLAVLRMRGSTSNGARTA
jgi:hypothetical protein